MDLYVAGFIHKNKVAIKDKDTCYSTSYTYDEVLDMVLNQDIVIKGVTKGHERASKLYISSIYPYKPYIEYIQIVYLLTGIKLYVRDGYLVAVDTDGTNRLPITLRLSNYIRGVDYFGFEYLYAPNITFIVDNKLNIKTDVIGSGCMVNFNIRELNKAKHNPFIKAVSGTKFIIN